MSIDTTQGADREDGTVPDPDDPRKPDSPTKLTKRSWFYVLRKTWREFGDDQCTDVAAALTYYSVLSIFPAAIALLSLLGVIGQAQTSVDTVVEVLDPLVSEDMLGTIEPTLRTIADNQSAGLLLVVGLVGALWTASGYVGAFGRAMNRIYEVAEGRPVWKLRPLQILITLLTILLLAVALVLLAVSGPVAESVGEVLGVGDTAVQVWSIAKWPILALVAVLVVALLYYSTPNVKQPRFRWISVGAAIAIVIGIVASIGFTYYVSNFGSYNKTYGSLAGAVVGAAVPLDHQPGAALRCRARLRARARPPAPGRDEGGGGAAAPRARHPQHRQGRQEGGQGHRPRPPDPRAVRRGLAAPGRDGRDRRD